jgi:hypothetical protein
MLSYPSAISLSTRSLNHLGDLIRARWSALRRQADGGEQNRQRHRRVETDGSRARHRTA